MNQPLLDRIANAVLYEGYILYPYRPSIKNRHRWTFGGLVPRSFSQATAGSDAWTMQTECAIVPAGEPLVSVTVRFLHLVDRQVGKPATPFTAEPFLEVDGTAHYSWQEAVERTIALPALRVEGLLEQPRIRLFEFPRQVETESLWTRTGQLAGLIRREQQAVEGELELSAERAAEGLFKLRATIRNLTALDRPELRTRAEALMKSLVSTHTILTLQDGEFVSQLDPPPEWQAVAAGCRNDGTWPVLVGEDGERDTMLSAPIILYDYPQVAPESPGDFFDATEIDEMLALRVMTLTDEEKLAMASVDERTRALLQRTSSLPPEQMSGLHGTMRAMRPVRAEETHE
jgi:hydrogenase maturation protease